jgi:vesicle coat complex subunit
LDLIKGYLAVTLMLNEQDDLTKLVVHSIRKDLEDSNEVTSY